MPEIKFKHILSCSSEDPQFPADNLLRPESFKKWKCVSSGEKQAVVIIQLDKASEIQSIDIGNEGSAFVEILVGKSSEGPSVNYHVLLASSSFMSPTESKNGSNINRVRMFSTENLSKDALNDKWDLVKIICTQPFNRNLQYGLSFVRFDEPGETTFKTDDKNSLAGFAIKSEENSTSDTFQPGSLFKKRSYLHEEVKLPSSNAAKNDRGDNAGVSKDYLNKAALKIISKDSETKSTSSCVPQLKRGSSKEETSVAKSAKPTLAPVTRADSGKDNDSKSMPSTSKETKAKTIKYVDFSKLMDEVVFTLSGFVNPQRAELREKACEMGATFKSDWDKDCSHLICAFSNTPKYNQVKGKGKIVKADWIVDSHKNRKLMSWQKYSFEKVMFNPDEEVELIAKAPVSDMKETDSQKKRKGNISTLTCKGKRKRPADQMSEEELYNMSTDEEENDSQKVELDGDTDDEIFRHQAKQQKSETETSLKKKAKIALDDEGLPVLPDLFDGLVFYLYGSFSTVERKQIDRYVATLNGKLVDYMNDSVTHVVTNSHEWDSGFTDALEENPNLKFVKSGWIMSCGKTMKRQPIEEFLLTLPAT